MLAVGVASRLQRFSAAQVCQIITGDDGEVDYIFPDSDDELDALELHEINEDQAGTDDDTDDTLTHHLKSLHPHLIHLFHHLYAQSICLSHHLRPLS